MWGHRVLLAKGIQSCRSFPPKAYNSRFWWSGGSVIGYVSTMPILFRYWEGVLLKGNPNSSRHSHSSFGWRFDMCCITLRPGMKTPTTGRTFSCFLLRNPVVDTRKVPIFVCGKRTKNLNSYSHFSNFQGKRCTRDVVTASAVYLIYPTESWNQLLERKCIASLQLPPTSNLRHPTILTDGSTRFYDNLPVTI